MAWWTRSSTWFPLTRRRGSHPIWTWLRPWRPCLWSRQAARQRKRTWLWKSWPRTQWQKSRGNMTKNIAPFPNNRIEPLHRRVFLLLSQVETTKIVIIFFLLMSCDTSINTYWRISFENSLSNEIREVKGITDKGHPTKQVGDTKHSQTTWHVNYCPQVVG